MPATPNSFTGIHAATVLPLKPDFSTDEKALAAHLAAVSGARGIRGLLINGHAGENFVATREQKRRVIEIAREVVQEARGVSAKGCVLCSGVNAESSLEAAEHARDAKKAGADALLVFPPNSWALGHDADLAERHHRAVADAGKLPLVLYQAPVGAGHLAYKAPVIERLLGLKPVVAIKEGSWEVAAYEENRRLVKRLRPEVSVMGSGDEHLLTSYIIGSEGSQVSLAAVVPEVVVGLWEAADRGDWAEARRMHERLYPLSVAIYRAPPGGRANARLKACLKILGRLACDAVTPPIGPLPREEYKRLEAALAHAGAR